MPEGIPVMKQGERVKLPELRPVLPLMDRARRSLSALCSENILNTLLQMIVRRFIL